MNAKLPISFGNLTEGEKEYDGGLSDNNMFLVHAGSGILCGAAGVGLAVKAPDFFLGFNDKTCKFNHPRLVAGGFAIAGAMVFAAAAAVSFYVMGKHVH